jgi:hypothetical protein
MADSPSSDSQPLTTSSEGEVDPKPSAGTEATAESVLQLVAFIQQRHNDAADFAQRVSEEVSAAQNHIRELVASAESDRNGVGDRLKEVEATSATASTLNEEIRSKLSQLQADLQAAKEAQAVLQTRLEDLNTVSAQAKAASTQITENQAVIATKSDHIESARKHADQVRAELDRRLTAATQQATDAEALKARTQSAADQASNAFSVVQTSKAQIEADAKAIAEAKAGAERAVTTAKGLADRSEQIEARLTSYESALAELKQQADQRLKSIDDLLPGAAGAGLAHEFSRRRRSFKRPELIWQFVFVLAVGTIIVIAWMGLRRTLSTGLPSSGQGVVSTADAAVQVAPLTYEQVLVLWLVRLPIIGALVWLAIHAGHEAAMAKRLEEDYGFKAATAASFEGFHRKMKEIESDLASDSAVARHCEDALAIFASPPGRIYDKHALQETPAGELAKAVKAAASSLQADKSDGA